MRVCAEPGCPTLTQTTRCLDHTRERDRARGTSTERGYGYDHQKERAGWVPVVKAGGVLCRRCKQPIDPNEPWDLGHPDAHCPDPKAPEHMRQCNRATAAHRKAVMEGGV